MKKLIKLSRGKSYSQILPQVTSKIQLFEINEVLKYAEGWQLTDALDLLEKRGFVGDLALFLIATLQSMEVAQ